MVAGIEARGFVLAAAVAYATGVGVVPVRKAGKLPRATHSATLRPGVRRGDAGGARRTRSPPGQRVLVVDDVLATGGTAGPRWTWSSGPAGRSAGFTVLLELAFLGGRERAGRPSGACPADRLSRTESGARRRRASVPAARRGTMR